jgi:hypothetical protein
MALATTSGAEAASRDALSIKAFGAAGDGTRDDTKAIQAAIDAAPADAGVIVFPAGTYRLTAPIEVIDSTERGNRRGLRLIGAAGGGSGASIGCQLLWEGPADQPMLRMWSRDCIVTNLAFRVARGRRALAAIDIDQAPGGRTTTTNNNFAHLLLTKADGAMTYGVRMGARASANTEYMGFDSCYFEDIDRACVYIPSRTGQAKAHRFYKCVFARAPFGILHETGSFTTFGCGFSELSSAAIQLGSITDYIAINETDSEACARLLVTAGGSSASWAVKIDGGRFALNGLAPDGRFIDFTDGGPLLIQNSLFGNGGRVPHFKIRARSAEPGAVVIAVGNVFPNERPFDLDGRCRLVTLGNRGYGGGGAPLNLDDTVAAAVGAGGQLALTTVTSISGTQTRAENLRGSARIADGEAQAQVRFARPEPDGMYYVSATVSGVKGNPSWSARRAGVTAKSDSGFTIVLENAPGPGNSVTVDWILVR